MNDDSSTRTMTNHKPTAEERIHHVSAADREIHSRNQKQNSLARTILEPPISRIHSISIYKSRKANKATWFVGCRSNITSLGVRQPGTSQILVNECASGYPDIFISGDTAEKLVYLEVGIASNTRRVVPWDLIHNSNSFETPRASSNDQPSFTPGPPDRSPRQSILRKFGKSSEHTEFNVFTALEE
jgi:hypothetical protein